MNYIHLMLYLALGIFILGTVLMFVKFKVLKPRLEKEAAVRVKVGTGKPFSATAMTRHGYLKPRSS
jgi:hypothetical protein